MGTVVCSVEPERHYSSGSKHGGSGGATAVAVARTELRIELRGEGKWAETHDGAHGGSLSERERGTATNRAVAHGGRRGRR